MPCAVSAKPVAQLYRADCASRSHRISFIAVLVFDLSNTELPIPMAQSYPRLSPTYGWPIDMYGIISSDCLYEAHTYAANQSPLVLAQLNVADEAQCNKSRRESYISIRPS